MAEPKNPVSEEVKDAITTQGLIVNKLVKTRDKLRGPGLEKAVQKFRDKQRAKLKEAEETLSTEVRKLNNLTGK